MQFQVEILSVVGPVKNQKGKNTWNVFEVAYKKDGKIEGKKIVDFNSPDVFKAVGEAKQGQVYTVTAEKINDFWQWVGFTQVGAGSPTPPAESKTSTPESDKGVTATEGQSSGRSSGRVTGSNYETPEERVVKQRYIARQSSLGYALTLLTHNSIGTPVPVEVVENLAERFVKFVYKNDPVKALAEMEDDIPY